MAEALDLNGDSSEHGLGETVRDNGNHPPSFFRMWEAGTQHGLAGTYWGLLDLMELDPPSCRVESSAPKSLRRAFAQRPHATGLS